MQDHIKFRSKNIRDYSEVNQELMEIKQSSQSKPRDITPTLKLKEFKKQIEEDTDKKVLYKYIKSKNKNGFLAMSENELIS